MLSWASQQLTVPRVLTEFKCIELRSLNLQRLGSLIPNNKHRGNSANKYSQQGYSCFTISFVSQIPVCRPWMTRIRTTTNPIASTSGFLGWL